MRNDNDEKVTATLTTKYDECFFSDKRVDEILQTYQTKIL